MTTTTEQLVEVPPTVFLGIEDVRDSGRANMCRINEVLGVCGELGHFNAAAWIQDNQSLYEQGVTRGFAVGSSE